MNSRMMRSLVVKSVVVKTVVLKTAVVSAAFALVMTGCVFGENQQYFSKLPGNGGLDAHGGASVTDGTETPGEVPCETGCGGGSTGGGSGSTGSTGSDVPIDLPEVRHRDSFAIGVNQSPKIDVLFCVDNSGSMSDNQRILADSFQGFIGGFVGSGLDFHIGIVTSDVDSDRRSVWVSRMPDYPDANRGRLLTRYPSDRYLTPQTAGLVSRFQDNVRVGTRGSSREQCLNSFLFALDPALLADSGWNHGFFRSDSLLAFVVVSDENEDIQNRETIGARVQRLKERVASLSGPSSRGARYDFIVNLSVAPPRFVPGPGQLQYYPARYLEASRLLAGRNYDISRNFSSDLLTISEGMVQQALHEFGLSQIPGQAPLFVVRLGGQELQADPIHGYVYHADRNTIELVGLAALQAEGQTLQVEYSL